MSFRNTALGLADPDKVADDTSWAERADHWAELAEPLTPDVYLRKPRIRRPLVLAGHGIRLRIDKQTLLVREGITRYPQHPRELRFFPGDPRLPSRIVLLDSPNGSLSFGVISWLAVRRIPLVLLDRRGQVVSAIGSEPRSGDSELRAAQLSAQQTEVGTHLAAWLIAEKLRASVDTLRTLPGSARIDRAIDRIDYLDRSLRLRTTAGLGELLISEARGASAYFGAWLDLPVRWKGTGRRPIPPEWRRMPLRQSLLGASNRNAGHPVAACLNYGYGVLQTLVREAIAIEGLDADISFLHTSRPGRQALVYDAMEPLRPVADRATLRLVVDNIFAPGAVAVTSAGVCRLNVELARYLVSTIRLEAVAFDLTKKMRELVEPPLGSSNEPPNRPSNR